MKRASFLFVIIIIMLLSAVNASSNAEDFVLNLCADNKTFSACNYHTGWFGPDPNNPLPWPLDKWWQSSENMAELEINAAPGEAGVGYSLVGLQINIDYDNFPEERAALYIVDLKISYEYYIEADFNLGYGSADARIGVSHHSQDWEYSVGYPAAAGVKHGATVYRTSLSIAELEESNRRIYMMAYVHGHTTPEAEAGHHAYARIAITGMEIDILNPTCCPPHGGELRPVDGYLGFLAEERTTEAGQILQKWCIQIDDGFAWRARYKGLDGVWRWFGGCYFDGAWNFYGFNGSNLDDDPECEIWNWLMWSNVDTDNQCWETVEEEDYHWLLNCATNWLMGWSTLNGERINPTVPDWQGEAPEDFTLLPNPTCGSPKSMGDSAATGVASPKVIISLRDNDTSYWNYQLYGVSMSDWYSIMIHQGDEWSIAAMGVDSASAPENWTVNLVPDYVTWQYIGSEPFDLSQAGPIDGFIVYSNHFIGNTNWSSSSHTDTIMNFDYSGSIGGPMYESHPTCGDSNTDGTINVADVVYIINYIFKNGPVPEPVCVADADYSGDISVGDPVYLINYIFKGGPPPVAFCCL